MLLNCMLDFFRLHINMKVVFSVTVALCYIVESVTEYQTSKNKCKEKHKY